MSWQPISTAPKDGTIILAFETMWLDVPFTCFWWGDCWIFHCPGGNIIEMNPNYWMPLPEPPKSEEE